MTTPPTWPAPAPEATPNGPHTPAQAVLNGPTAAHRSAAPIHPAVVAAGAHDDLQRGNVRRASW